MTDIKPRPNKGAFDVDGTLIEKFRYRRYHKDDLEFDYYGTPVFARALLAQIIFLKACFARGDQIIVWSANGEDWAREVVNKLGITQSVHIFMDKPLYYVDDNEADKWMKRIMIDEKVQE